MKNEDYIKMETSLQNAWDCIQDAYETCDTSLTDYSYESDAEINDWNSRLIAVQMELMNLRAEMIFTFRIEEPKK